MVPKLLLYFMWLLPYFFPFVTQHLHVLIVENRVSTVVDSAVKKADFMRAYDQLCQGRATYDKARHRLDLAIQRHSEALSLHREANAQVNQLKDRFIEVWNIAFTR